MAILALGVSHRRATVDLLERLAFPDDDLPKAYSRLADLDAIEEAVILSTCNRVEVYAHVTSYHAGFLELKRFLADSREVAPEEFAEPLYSHYEDQAAEHLFSVAAGIDSMVVGEPQILSQVRQAFRRAEGEGAAGPLLSALFRAAIRTGRRARAETSIASSPWALVEAGADLAARALGGLEGRSALIVGAGAMAGIAAEHLREQDVSDIRIVSRTVERAAAVAARSAGHVGDLSKLASSIARADLVVSSTGAPGVVIGPEVVRDALVERQPGRPVFVLDLAVPRDVDPGVAHIPGVVVANIDDLRDALTAKDDGRAAEVARVREIVGEEVNRFASWRRAAAIAPLIQALVDFGEQVKDVELARVAPRLSTLSEHERAAVEALARGVVAKLLHEPIVRVKELSGRGAGNAHARALAELFGIDFRPEA